MIFQSARDRDSDTYMSLFTEAMRNASPEDMRDEVQDACEYFESFRVPNERTGNRLNNATYTITQIVARLVGRLQEAEARLDQVADDRAHAEARKLLDMHTDTLLVHGPQVAQGVALAITVIDPYMGPEDRLVRKSDGTPVGAQEKEET